MHFLEAVIQHGAVDLLEYILPNPDLVIRRDAEHEILEGGRWSLHIEMQLRAWGSPRGSRARTMFAASSLVEAPLYRGGDICAS